MKINRKPWAALLIATALLRCGPATAGDIDRGNPFTAPPNWSEEQARMDERMRIVFRQLEPEVKEDIMKRVNESQAALEIKMRKRIDLVIQNIGTAPAGPGGTPGQPAQAADTKKSAVTDGSSFISCVNGKALYRDKNNTLYRVPEEDPESVAHRCGK
jgi:hypothetical protein